MNDLTYDDIDLIRNALRVWADRNRWDDGDEEFSQRLDALSDKIWDIVHDPKQIRERQLRAGK